MCSAIVTDSLLRQRFALPAGAADIARVTLGDAVLDAALGGGLERAALHECFAHNPDQSAAVTGFAALIARRACAKVKRSYGSAKTRAIAAAAICGAGLTELGVDPTDMFAVHAPDATAALRASADIVKCSGVGAVVLELWGRAPLYDLTASRRLTMAAARSGVVMLVVRVDAAPRASAARTRWSAASAPSHALAANAPGLPAFDIVLLRHRGGIAGFEARLSGIVTQDVSRRYLAAFLPWLSSERISRAAPHKAPFVLVEKLRGAMRVAAVDRSAAALGLAPGLTLADARARVPDLLAFDHDAGADRALLDWLVEACDRYSPSVMADPPHNLGIDIAGCTHRYADAADGLAADLAQRLERIGITARLALGETPDASRARAEFGIDNVASLPVEALRVEGETHVALRRAGLTTLGAVAKRPRANVAARFGKALVDRLDRIVGGIDTRLTPNRVEDPVVVEARFAEPIARTEDMLSTLARLTGEAAVDLGQRGVGGRRFDVALFRSDGHVARLTVETAAPTRDPALVERLLRERIDALADPLDPGFGYDLVRLAVPVSEALAPAQLRLEGGTLADSELAALIDRLVTRLGRNRVRRFARADSHIPEQASFTLPIADAPRLPPIALEPGEPPLRPLHLFEPPQRIEVLAEVPDGPPVQFRWRRTHHRVTRFEGPERIAAEWWQRQGGYEDGKSGLTRDYYRVEDASGRRFWLFRHGLYGERANPGWYMHGLFA